LAARCDLRRGRAYLIRPSRLRGRPGIGTIPVGLQAISALDELAVCHDAVAAARGSATGPPHPLAPQGARASSLCL
jgi:hypothetical protein